MKANVDSDTLKKARLPHNIFMLNLALVHLLQTPAVIALDIGISGMLLPLTISLLIILYTALHSKKIQTSEHTFVYNHWKLALKRYRLLLLAYVITAGLIILGWILAMSSPDENMREILHTVFIRI